VNQWRNVFALCLGLTLIAPRARADEAQDAQDARTQFTQGREAFQAKRFAEAAQHFETAASLRPHAVALLTAGLAWDAAGQPDRAADALARCMDMPGLDAKQSSQAHERLAQLEKTLGTVQIIGPEGTRVQLDGASAWLLPARIHAAPGAKVLHIVPPAGVRLSSTKRDLVFEAGTVASLTIEPDRTATPAARGTARTSEAPSVLPPSPGQEAAPRGTSFSLRQGIGLSLVGASVLGLGAGVVLGTQALSAKDAYDAAPSRAAFDHANGLATWSTVAFVAGGVLAAGGVTLLVLPSDKKTNARVVPTGLGLALRVER